MKKLLVLNTPGHNGIKKRALADALFFKTAAIQLYFDAGTRKKLEIFSAIGPKTVRCQQCYNKMYFRTVRPNLSRKIVPGKDARRWQKMPNAGL